MRTIDETLKYETTGYLRKLRAAWHASAQMGDKRDRERFARRVAKVDAELARRAAGKRLEKSAS